MKQSDLPELPARPGVYIFKSSGGIPLYIGKASSLAERVKSYFSGNDSRGRRIELMVERAASLEFIVTENEWDALLLENNLIKKYRPAYNIELRDDKNYPFIRLSTNEPFPRAMLVRKIKRDGGTYFGPYRNASAIRNTMRLLEELFAIRSCNWKPPRKLSHPCLKYDMGRCQAPCTGRISPEEYSKAVKKAIEFLKGRHRELAEWLEKEMRTAAEELRFEEAAKFRDYLEALKIIERGSDIVSTASSFFDVIAWASSDEYTAIVLFAIREGRLTGSRNFTIEGRLSGEEIVDTFISSFYQCAGYIPPRIYIQEKVENCEFASNLLSRIAGGRVRVLRAERGSRANLVATAHRNALLLLGRKENQIKDHEENIREIWESLSKALHLEKFPERVECFDISNIFGSSSTGAMVVATNMVLDKKQYRKFKIKSVTGIDDFSSIKEVLRRRFAHSQPAMENSSSQLQAENRNETWPLPDLLVIDGGAGHLSAALEVLRETGFNNIEIISLAKKEEAIFSPRFASPVLLPARDPGLRFLQRLRDEAHRFALSFHRSLRNKKMFHSPLDEIRGLGQVLKKRLLEHFGSLEVIKKAGPSELALVKGISEKLAKKIHAHFHSASDSPEESD